LSALFADYSDGSFCNRLYNLIQLDMKTNMGTLDKVIRVIVAIIGGLLVYYDVVVGVYSYIVLAIVAIFLLTSLIGFCPLYGLFGMNTCKVKK